jgi:putative ABC transport system ATP-binding protein
METSKPQTQNTAGQPEAPASNGQALIQMEAVRKVFYTDEVETHALAGIHLVIKKGEYIAIAGPSGCGKSTLLSIMGLLDTPTDGKYILNGAHPQPRSGLHLSEFQPDW